MKRQIVSLVSLLTIAIVGGACASAATSAPVAPKRNPLLEPTTLTATAPDVYQVRFETSKGPFVVEVNRAWAPQGADRLYNLVQNHYYDDVRFFRVVSGFMAQFGLHGDPAINTAWDSASIQDDPVVGSNTRGTMTFAMAGPNSRTTQVYINLVDNVRLDRMGFAPFGRVIEGMEVVDALHSGYGEGAPRGRGPRQDRIGAEGNAYLAAEFPELDYVVTARIVK